MLDLGHPVRRIAVECPLGVAVEFFLTLPVAILGEHLSERGDVEITESVAKLAPGFAALVAAICEDGFKHCEVRVTGITVVCRLAHDHDYWLILRVWGLILFTIGMGFWFS